MFWICHFTLGLAASPSPPLAPRLCRRDRRGSRSSFEFQSFFQRRTQVLQKFGARLALGIDSWNLIHPADPPAVVLLDYCIKRAFHALKLNPFRSGSMFIFCRCWCANLFPAGRRRVQRRRGSSSSRNRGCDICGLLPPNLRRCPSPGTPIFSTSRNPST